MPTEMFATTEYTINGDPYTQRDLHGSGGGAGHTYDLEFNNDLDEVTLTEDSVDKTTLPLVATFVGTRAEWNNLSAAEQAKYRIAHFTDESEGISDAYDIPHGQSNVGDDLDDLQGAITDINASFNAQHRRKRGTFTPSGLRQCITSDGVDLSIMRYSIGDEYQINGNYKAVIADVDTFYGGYDSCASVSSHHVGLLIVGKAGTITCKWNNTNSTTSGYNGSVLHTTLKGLISTIESALGTLLSHQKALTTATSNWAWQTSQKISALSESQIYGAPIWSLDGYQQGEACRQLEIFRKFSFHEIFGNQSVWLRSIMSASYVCAADGNGNAGFYIPSSGLGVVGLVLFH